MGQTDRHTVTQTYNAGSANNTYHDDLDPLCDWVWFLLLLRQLPRLRQLLNLQHRPTAAR